MCVCMSDAVGRKPQSTQTSQAAKPQTKRRRKGDSSEEGYNRARRSRPTGARLEALGSQSPPLVRTTSCQ
jgi:hypothetical protein